ncbi:GH25 family lysozyme (plasmid) [Streptomyces sp. NBC_01591]|uniref:peptidoglycan-binding protein n=1 Tax=Streptomyces sp. NBC_01591 TaxID=2975888 RepID=UPI002DD9E7B1|nr:peptidoglycan-binding protein [Streptomyces sp. NBC_01591]WSD74315.1 GH25 family lysozyme [Streptomyces sp. NBC_01591]
MRKTTKKAISWTGAALASGGMLFAGLTILPADASSPASFSVKGVDTSHYNHTGGAAIDWNKVRASGHVFMFAKATEGADWSDRWFSRDLQGAKQAGLMHGAYHFYGRTPGAAQARNFVNAMKAAGYTGTRAGELPPTLDLELDKAGRCPGNFSTTGVRAFLDAVTAQMGVKPIIYTTKSFVDTCMNGNGSMFTGHVLWQPRYESGSKEPAAVPRAGQGWKIWQYTETGTVSGIPSKNRVDVNVFRGSLAELRQLAHLGAGGGTTPAPPQPTVPPVAGAPVLKADSSGTDVVTAQELLNASGARIDADGVFGPATTAAVRSFQNAKGLEADGIIGSRTWGALLVTVKQGSRGSAVRALQHQLNASGVRIDADGVFGPATTAAVRSFQNAKKLPADGIADPRTWSLLLTDKSGGSGGVPAGNAVALAKQLLGTPGITFARQHSETRHSASTAHANIADMAAGRGALTSPGSHVGSKRVQLDPRMLQGLLTLHDRYGYRMNVSEFVGGVHSKTSRHYRGLSFDVNVINGKHVGSGAPHRSLMTVCSQLGATEIIGPPSAGHKTHVHCAWK